MLRVKISGRAQIIAIRHARAEKVKKGQHDCVRKLSIEGLRQAISIHEKLFWSLGANWKPDMVVRSTRVRVHQTLDAIVGVAGVDHQAPVHTIPYLFTHPVPKNERRIGKMLDRLGPATLREYQDKFRGATELMELADLALFQILSLSQLLHYPNDPKKVTNIVVGGHAVLLPAILHSLTGEDRFLHYNMPECGAVVYDTNTKMSQFFEPKGVK